MSGGPLVVRGMLERAIVVLGAAIGFQLSVLAWFPFAIDEWMLSMGLGAAGIAAMVTPFKRAAGTAVARPIGALFALAAAMVLFPATLAVFAVGLPSLFVDVQRLASPARYDPSGRARHIQFEHFAIDPDRCRQVFREGSGRRQHFIELTMGCPFRDRPHPPWLAIQCTGRMSTGAYDDQEQRARVRAELVAEMDHLKTRLQAKVRYFERTPGLRHDDLWRKLGDQHLVPREAEVWFLDARADLLRLDFMLGIAAVLAGLFLAALRLAVVLGRGPRAGQR